MTKLVAKTPFHHRGKIYDITVENTHSYNIEGVPVHNCGGSLVAYLTNITDVDPIRFDLLFERFINPDRVDLPDADLDFMSGRRHEVVDYIISKYGRENVAGIVNFSTLGPASALRDTARLHGLQPWEYDCSKQMEKEHGVSLSLTESAERVPDIDKFRLEHPAIWNHALRLEGANRSLSQHAAGVVVAGEPVVNRAVVSTRGGESALPVVQWDKSKVEDFGLIKIDVLGLNTLDLIGESLKYIKERHHKTIDILALPLDDKRVLNAFGKGDTTGVFQFSGCLAGDSMIDGISIKERYENQDKTDIRSLDESSMQITKGKVSRIIDSGKKIVYNLKLKNGKMIKASANHPFFMDGKWVRLEHLRPGDRVLTTKE